MKVVLLLVISLALYVLADTSDTTCPSVDANLAKCPFDYVTTMTDFIDAINIDHPNRNCTRVSKMNFVYQKTASIIYRGQFGTDATKTIFVDCDANIEDVICIEDLSAIHCTCANSCDKLGAVRGMTETIEMYPNWETDGVPWGTIL